MDQLTVKIYDHKKLQYIKSLLQDLEDVEVYHEKNVPEVSDQEKKYIDKCLKQLEKEPTGVSWKDMKKKLHAAVK